MKRLRRLRHLIRRIPPRYRYTLRAVVGVWALVFVISCSSTRCPHDGRFPFSLMEKPPRARSVPDAHPMEPVLSYDATAPETFETTVSQLQPGDVVGLVMSHQHAWGHLRQGRIQKIPYELFRFGHVALAVPDPDAAPGTPITPNDLRFLNVAMKHPVNADEGIEWLRDQSWRVYRPAPGSIDAEHLREFTRIVCDRAGDPKMAYDYTGALGLHNVPSYPDSADEIGSEYTCATLIVAALHYSGYRLEAIHRGGILDIVTPRQVLEARGREVASSELVSSR